MKAIEKAPDSMPYFVFIDINAPLDADVDERWKDRRPAMDVPAADADR